MRMRKLGQGQSVVFCVPKEIETKILESAVKQDGTIISVADILIWAISETCADLRRSMSLWAVQGNRHEGQKNFWASAQSDYGYRFSTSQAEQFLEAEAQTLEYRYRPLVVSEASQFSGWDIENKNVSRIIDRCQRFTSMDFTQSALHEEQERELSPEIEREREVERPASAEPEMHHIHNDVRTLVRTGKFVAESQAFLPAFEALGSSSAASYFDVSQFSHNLFVTADFARTIKVFERKYISDAYQRPVQWVLTTGCGYSNTVEHMIVFSPFEVQELLSDIKMYLKVTLHLYAPRPNLEFRPLDTLDLFTEGKAFNPHSVPPYLTVQLNLFAGQLYMGSLKEYTEVCKFLGLASRAVEEGFLVGADGFIISGPGKSRFTKSPVEFLKVLLTKVRRSCESIDKTHLGRLLYGALLDEADFNN